MIYKFSGKSLKNLRTCHTDLQIVAAESLKISDIDFGITYGRRTQAEQKKLFMQGRRQLSACVNPVYEIIDKTKVVTYLDGYHRKSKHNFTPSLAFDIAAYSKEINILYDKFHLIYLAGIIITMSKRLLFEGKIKHKIIWGGNWDGDGIIIKDHNFVDFPHFEISL